MRIAFAFAVLACFPVVACATSDRVIVGDGGTAIPITGDTSQTVPVTDASSFCAAMCNRVQSCDKALDSQTCENECTNGNAAIFPRLRADVVDLIVECFDGKDCKTVLGGGFVGACTADAIATVAPSAAASSFCDALASAKKTCSGATSNSKAECLNSAKLYGDQAIGQAQNCVKRACSEIDTCVGAVFGSLGGGTTTKPSSSTCSRTFSDLGQCSTCAETSCCAQATACYGDSNCHDIARACMTGGTSSTACSQAYSYATQSSQQLASALLSCSQSSCASTCRLK